MHVQSVQKWCLSFLTTQICDVLVTVIVVVALGSLSQPRSKGLSSLPPLVVGTETLVAAGHVTTYPSKTAGWVGTQVHLP